MSVGERIARRARGYVCFAVAWAQRAVYAWVTVRDLLFFREDSYGIGVFFDTRKGSFRYKISLHIITYHVAIIVYHFVSLSISQYIMSIGDT